MKSSKAKEPKVTPQKKTAHTLSAVHEPMSYYGSYNAASASPVIFHKPILHHAATKPENKLSSFEKIAIIKEGISKADLESLKDFAALDYNQLSKILSVARATLINKKGTEKFDVVLSEKIVSVADVYAYGYEVFEDENRFNSWVFRPNKSIGGQCPYDLMDNQYGRDEVKNLIGRIDYGVYS